jgi:hypothetical protein
MKKYISILAITVVAAATSFAQGTLVFVNSSTSTVKAGGTNVPSGGGSVEFLWGATSAQAPASSLDLNPAGWTALAGTIKSLSPAGRFNAGTFTINGIAPGAVVGGLVRGWTGAFATYAEAIAGGAMIGYSAPFTVDTGDPTTTPPGTAGAIFNSTAAPFTGLTVSLVPEPSSMVLAGLGAASLLLFRRRK